LFGLFGFVFFGLSGWGIYEFSLGLCVFYAFISCFLMNLAWQKKAICLNLDWLDEEDKGRFNPNQSHAFYHAHHDLDNHL